MQISRHAFGLIAASLIPLLLLPAPPTRAQEVVSILNQKEWSVRGVGISDHYATCAATDSSQSDASIWLQVTETPSQNIVNEVSVMHPGDPQATAAILQIGGDRFALAMTAGEHFSSAANDGGKIVAAMLSHDSLTMQLEGVSAPKPYGFDLAEFPAAYSALVEHCGAPANP